MDASVDDLDRLDRVIGAASQALCDRQQPDGHWVFELEADATVPAEYVLLQHYLDEIDEAEETKIGAYLRAAQNEDGGWPLFAEGETDVSCTVKSYYALKMIGDKAQAPHMRRAREAVLARGGAARSNVFTRFTLSLFGQVPWRACPIMPAEIMFLPRWFPFHLSKVSYWSRTVIAPLVILATLKPRARNPRNIGVAELFVTPPDKERAYITNPTGARLGDWLLRLDRLMRVVEPRVPKSVRKRAVSRAADFVVPRLNGEAGLGAIFPAMANAVMALDALGHPQAGVAKRAIKKLFVEREDDAYCQPCFSSGWDTGLAAHALLEVGEASVNGLERCFDWLLEREVTRADGDWAWQRPGLAPGGWAFQYENDHYPDVDDTAVVAMAMQRADAERYKGAVGRAADWIIGMQCKNGGWGSFDADNTHTHLNHLPFADHGALLDPPSVDVSARCLGLLAQMGYQRTHPAVSRGLAYLRQEQEENGSWFGRWGVNYIYGTWSALAAFNAAGEDLKAPHIGKAVEWLCRRQNADGGWGEDCTTYGTEQPAKPAGSTPSQTAWAVLGLMASGEVESDAVRRGVRYLEDAPRDGAKWRETLYMGVGFPRAFYLRYHGYSAYFPLFALARYRNLKRRNDRRVSHGL